MKQVLRFGAVVLVACMLLTAFTGCNEISAYEMFTAAKEKANEQQDMDMSMEMNIKVTQNAVTAEIPAKISAKIKDASTNPVMQMDMQMTIPMLGDINVALYYADGVAYMDSMGAKTKKSISKEDFANDEAMSSMTDMSQINDLFNIDEKDFVVKETKKEDGKTVLTLKLPSSYINKLISESMTKEYTQGDYEFSDMDCEITLNEEGYMTTFVMDTSATGTAEGTAISMELSYTVTVNNPGKPVEIQAPADLDSYQEEAKTAA